MRSILEIADVPGHVETVEIVGLTRRLASLGDCAARLPRMSQELHPGYLLRDRRPQSVPNAGILKLHADCFALGTEIRSVFLARRPRFGQMLYQCSLV
jgi:hypothetical protein